jgi:hypothetical protein
VASFTVVDDGSGMKRRELARYHDIAASAKVRGEGIGFAGVGIKLGLLASEEVLTETRRGKTHVASTWRLASRQRAPWRWVPPPGLVAGHGTGVRLTLRNPLSPLLDGGFVEACLERQFQPLFDPAFDDVLARAYPRGVDFVLNGRPLDRRGSPPGSAPLAVRVGRKRKPAAVGYLVRDGGPLPEAARGLGVSTLGKVIKRGWDWLGVAPAAPEQVGGLVEVPGLAGSLTLNKADFLRTGPRGAEYLTYRKAIQEAVSAQLAAWGETRDRTEEARRRARPVERDLQRVLVDLAEDFPLLASLVERHAGGQARLPTGRAGLDVITARGEAPGAEPPRAEGLADPTTPAAPEHEPVPSPPAAPATAPSGHEAPVPGGPGPRRPTRYGLTIQFESRPEASDLGRLIESTVWVNEAHPAYRRAVASRAEGYHVALSVAMALAPLAVEPARAQGFITALPGPLGRRRRAGRRARAPGSPPPAPLTAGGAPPDD